MNNLSTYTLRLAGVMAVIIMFSVFVAKRDAQIAEGAAKYEACVLKEFNTTPAAYFEANGKYPECEK